jgi:hypothetical protein
MSGGSTAARRKVRTVVSSVEGSWRSALRGRSRLLGVSGRPRWKRLLYLSIAKPGGVDW